MNSVCIVNHLLDGKIHSTVCGYPSVLLFRILIVKFVIHLIFPIEKLEAQ